MKIQLAKKFVPKTSPRKGETSPLAKRIMRWHAWAERMAQRFGIRVPRLSFASKIFLQRPAMAHGSRQINYWQINWPSHACLAPARAGSIFLVGKHGAGLKKYPATSGMTSSPPVIAALRQRLLSEMTFRRHEFTEVGNVIHRQRLLRIEKLEALSRQFVRPRQRVEFRPGYSRSLVRDHPRLRPEEKMNEMNFNAPATPVFRQNKMTRDIEQSTVRQVQAPAAPSNMPFGATPLPLDLNQITDKVMQQIDRRLVIWRERTGRV